MKRNEYGRTFFEQFVADMLVNGGIAPIPNFRRVYQHGPGQRRTIWGAKAGDGKGFTGKQLREMRRKNGALVGLLP